MTKTGYITDFERHLRVAEPKRNEILAELKTHLEEAENPKILGNPKRLARSYNRTHIGLLFSPLRIHLAIIFIAFAFSLAHLLTIAYLVTGQELTGSTPPELLRDVLNSFGFMASLLLTLYIGVTIVRMYRGHIVLLDAMVTTYLTIFGLNLLSQVQESHSPYYYAPPTLGSLIFGATLSALAVLFWLAIPAMLTVLFVSAPPKMDDSNIRYKLRLETALSVFGIIVTFFLVNSFTASLIPYQMLPSDVLPTSGSAYRMISDFLHGPTIGIITTGIVAYLLGRRLLHRRRTLPKR